MGTRNGRIKFTPAYIAETFIRQQQYVQLRQHTPWYISPAPRQYTNKKSGHAKDIGVNIYGFQSGMNI